MKQLFLPIESCSVFASAQPTCVSVPLELGGWAGRAPQGSAVCRKQRALQGRAIKKRLFPPPGRCEQRCEELAGWGKVFAGTGRQHSAQPVLHLSNPAETYP